MSLTKETCRVSDEIVPRRKLHHRKESTQYRNRNRSATPSLMNKDRRVNASHQRHAGKPVTGTSHDDCRSRRYSSAPPSSPDDRSHISRRSKRDRHDDPMSASSKQEYDSESTSYYGPSPRLGYVKSKVVRPQQSNKLIVSPSPPADSRPQHDRRRRLLVNGNSAETRAEIGRDLATRINFTRESNRRHVSPQRVERDHQPYGSQHRQLIRSSRHGRRRSASTETSSSRSPPRKKQPRARLIANKLKYSPSRQETIYGHPRSKSSSASPPRKTRAEGATRRREIEARRYNGRDPIDEYLVQFELLAARNYWTEAEKVSSLLCALDGPARSLLLEWNDPTTVNYKDVKRALIKRFGCTEQVQVHERALYQLRLNKGQSIQDLAHEIRMLARKAYPELDDETRERFNIKSFVRAIPDKTVSYKIKEKNPRTLQQACEIYTCYEALADDSDIDCKPYTTKRNHQVTTVKASDFNSNDVESSEHETTYERLAVTTKPAVIKQQDSSHVRQNQQPNQGDFPKKPCPLCGQPGHWKKFCPYISVANQPSQQQQPGRQPNRTGCFNCGQSDHRWRSCPNQQSNQGNGKGPAGAPQAWSKAPIRQF